MEIICPACSTRFKVSAAALGDSGRTVACSRCGHRWHARSPFADSPLFSDDDAKPPPPPPPPDLASLVMPDEPASAAPRTADPEPIPSGLRAMPSAPFPHPRALAEPPRMAAPLLWGLFGALLVATLAGLVLARDTVMRRYPNSIQMYRLVGLSAVQLDGLGVTNVKSQLVEEEGGKRLVVSGMIVNTSDEPRDLPMLRARLSSEKSVIRHWDFAPSTAHLAAKASAPFETELKDPDPDASDVVILLTELPAAQAAHGESAGAGHDAPAQQDGPTQDGHEPPAATGGHEAPAPEHASEPAETAPASHATLEHAPAAAEAQDAPAHDAAPEQAAAPAGQSHGENEAHGSETHGNETHDAEVLAP